MKKLQVGVIALLLSTLLMARQTPKVVVTASMIADMARQIAGDKFLIKCIVPIGGDPHLYEPTPRDAQLIADAQLILKNGLTFEGWLNELIENSGTKALVVRVTEGIQAIESTTYANSTDPHAWMDARNGLKYIENIKNALAQIDPENQEFFEQNYQKYRQELVQLDAYISTQIKQIPEARRVLITSHDAFQYYGRRYGIMLESVLGTSTDAEVQTADIIRLNKLIKERQVPALFIESTVNPKLLEQLAKDNKIEIGGKLYADSIGDADSPAPSYAAMLRYNTDVIVKALTRNIVAKAEPEEETAQEGDTSYTFVLYGIIGLLFLGGFLLVYKKLNG